MIWLKNNITKITNLLTIFLIPVSLLVMSQSLLHKGGEVTLNTMTPYITAGVIIVFILLNIFFFRDVKEFMTNEHDGKLVYYEFIMVSITGVSNMFLFCGLYYVYGLHSVQGIIKHDFLTSLYFSVVTWTTLGYGDLQPINELRMVAAMEALMGYLYMALLVGLFLSMTKIRVRQE
ncbi:MAG: ion channel [Desulfobulbaceae bacterium]|nr:ion channel [Desulfobulbaceae bacterium]